jgi:wyosine [tRNA(Phe)-imidazoG37] synthetase (radical SAM superfamily)
MINKRLFEWHGIDTTKNLGLDTFCPRPYDTVLIDKMGSCYLCECTSWLPQSVGNLHIQSLENILNSSVAGELQNSIADGSYRYCNNKQCSYLLSKGGKQVLVENGVPNKQIKNIRLAIDDSCNLSCPSCRTHQIFERDKFQLRKRYQLADKIIEYVKKQSHTINIHVGSDGDPFASLIYRYFVKSIKDLPNVRFTIQTNGLLIKKMYHRHTELFEKLDVLNLSIDGATKTTYESLRRGGSYEKIIENLEFIKELDKKFKVRLHCVVQKKNYKEMYEYIELGKKFNVDNIYFNKITDWNVLKNFSEEAVWKDTHPEYQEFAKIVKDIRNTKHEIEFFVETSNLT